MNRIPWRDLASVTINRHTRLDLIVVGSMKRVFSTACVIFHSFCELSWENGAGSRFFVLSEKIKTIAEKTLELVSIHISFITSCQTTWAAFSTSIPAVCFWLTRHSICIYKLISTICIEINDLCRRAWFWCYNQGGSPSSTRILLCLSADVFAGWLRATRLMDNRGPVQKYVRLDWTNIRWWYLACGTDFCQRSYVLCQIQMSVATKQCAAE